MRCTTVSCKGLPLARSAEVPPESHLWLRASLAAGRCFGSLLVQADAQVFHVTLPLLKSWVWSMHREQQCMWSTHLASRCRTKSFASSETSFQALPLKSGSSVRIDFHICRRGACVRQTSQKAPPGSRRCCARQHPIHRDGMHHL